MSLSTLVVPANFCLVLVLTLSIVSASIAPVNPKTDIALLSIPIIGLDYNLSRFDIVLISIPVSTLSAAMSAYPNAIVPSAVVIYSNSL